MEGKKQKSKIKKAFLWSHRWFGITIGFYFLLLGISGSYLVYGNTFDKWLFPKIRSSQDYKTPISIREIVDFSKKNLETDVDPLRITIPEKTTASIELGFNIPKPGERRRFLTAFIDPAKNEFKGIEVYKETLHGFFFRFHHDLFWGATGKIIVAVGGVFMLFILLSGLYLWWPKFSWIKSLKLGSMKNTLQMNLELHKFTGFYSLILMILVTFSGIYIAQPNWFAPSKKDSRPQGGSDPKPVDFNKVQKIVESLNLDPRPLEIQINQRNSTVRIVGVSQGIESQVNFDLETLENAEEILKNKENEKKPHEKMHQLQRNIHGGHFWGELGKALIFISGLLTALFYVTGIVVWWKKSGKIK